MLNKTFLKAMAVLTSAAVLMSSSLVSFAEGSLTQTNSDGESTTVTQQTTSSSETDGSASGSQTENTNQTEQPAQSSQETSTQNDANSSSGTTDVNTGTETTTNSTTNSTTNNITNNASNSMTTTTANSAVTQTPEKPFSNFKDVSTHWAKESLNRAYNDGIIKGFENSTMRPDDKITGAQMITILTRILNTSQQADVSGTGLSDSIWYKEAAAEALSLGIISKADISGLNSNMVRREACEMLAEAFQLKDGNPDMTKANQYTDFRMLSLNEKAVFASLVNDGYLQGWNGTLMLSNNITRAEFITILYRIIDDYADATTIENYSSLTGATVLSAVNWSVKNQFISHDIWLDAKVKTINIDDIAAEKIVIRSDSLALLSIASSNINKLVIAARSGDVNLDCSGIATTVVGSGSGTISLSPNGNAVEVTGDSRNVTIYNSASKLAISGNNNVITVASSADIENIVILGQGNHIKIDSAVKNLTIQGKSNGVSGAGSAEQAILYTSTSDIQIPVTTVTNKQDSGISGMSMKITAPSSLVAGNNLQASVSFTNAPLGKTVKVTWYKDNKESTSQLVTLSSDSKSTLTYYIDNTANLPSSCSISCKAVYVTDDGSTQTITAPTVTVALSKPVVKTTTTTSTATNTTVETYYKGNYTTQWAIQHNLSDAAKENFVNSKGYSSSTKYLVWVNIGTQYASVFLGSKGNWKLIRSGLVSTGAGDCTPRGVFKTTYKQTDWTTSTYTVKPVVRFYGAGYAFHSRLYNPGTTTLKGGSNGVGYPLSHGCVRMQADDIQFLYDYVPNGSTVVIY